MKVNLFCLTLASVGLLAAPVQARPVPCSFEIAEVMVFQGRDCNFELNDDAGSFYLASPDLAFFLYVNVESQGRADGSWNGWERESHAHEDLGT